MKQNLEHFLMLETEKYNINLFIK